MNIWVIDTCPRPGYPYLVRGRVDLEREAGDFEPGEKRNILSEKRFTAILLLAPLLISIGCATLTRSRTQRIPVTASPPGATVIVNGQRQGVTPLSLKLVRGEKNQVIRIECPGYNPNEIRPIRKPTGAPFFGNLLLGLIPAIAPAGLYSLANEGSGGLLIWTLSAAAFGVLFTAVDSGSGAINDFEPKEISVTLTKADGTPRVDTMLVDADDFKNIKWIRVRRD